MAKAKTPMIEKNVEKFITNNFGKKEIKKHDSYKFELFVNSMHIWQCSSPMYTANQAIGKDMSLGTAQGGDAFFISINNFDAVFTLKDDIHLVLDFIKKNAKSITFHFIQTKKSEKADWGDFLKFIDVPLKIWKGQEFDRLQPLLRELQNFIDTITDEDDNILGRIAHKTEVSFYTNKSEGDIDNLKRDWKTNIENKIKELEEYFGKEDENKNRKVSIHLRGASFLNEIYERLNSNTYDLLIKKEQVREVEEKKYLIGYITAKELLNCIAKEIHGVRVLYPDVFKNNIRLYLGGTDVNVEIEKTLREEPEKFHFYNNGLTITTKTIDTSNSKNFNISPVNIVNGCQTANSVFNVFKSVTKDFELEKVKIPLKVIVAQDQEFENITIRTNTQNGLEAKDLLSITAIQKDIEDSVDKIKFFGRTFSYKRQKSDSKDPKDVDYIIHLDDILRATFSTLMLIPNKVSGYYDLTTKKYLAKIFDERFAKLYTIVTILLKIVKSETEIYTEFNRLHYHICYLIYRFANKNEDINSIEAYFKEDKTLENQTELEQNELINAIYSNVYNVLKDEKVFKAVLEYVVMVIKTKYPALLDTSDKKKERILYDPVQKLKGVKGNKKAVFENFDADFSENFKILIDKLK